MKFRNAKEVEAALAASDPLASNLEQDILRWLRSRGQMKLYLIIATTTRAIVRAPHPTAAAEAAGLVDNGGNFPSHGFPPHKCIEIDMDHLDDLPSQNDILVNCLVKENPHS